MRGGGEGRRHGLSLRCATYATRVLGGQPYFQLQISLKGPPSQPHMLVADSKGRVRHITSSLLHLLRIPRATLAATGCTPQPAYGTRTAASPNLRTVR